VDPVGKTTPALLQRLASAWSNWPLARKQFVLVLLALAPVPMWIKFASDSATAENDVYRRAIRRSIKLHLSKHKNNYGKDTFLDVLKGDISEEVVSNDRERWPLAQLAMIEFPAKTDLAAAASDNFEISVTTGTGSGPALVTTAEMSSPQAESPLELPLKSAETGVKDEHKSAAPSEVTIDSQDGPVKALARIENLGEQITEDKDRSAQRLAHFAQSRRQEAEKNDAIETKNYLLIKLTSPPPAGAIQTAPDEYLIAVFDTELERRRYWKALREAILPIAVAVMSAAILILVVSRVVLRPVKQLSAVMRQVGREHDYTLRVPVRQADEIGDLQVGFNQLVSEVGALTSELEQRVAERTEDLDVAIRKLNRSNAALVEFARDVAHDLKAPLDNVKLIVDGMQRDCGGELPSDVNRRLDKIREQCQDESERIKRVLEYARIGHNLSDPQAVDLNQVIEATHRGLAEQFQTCAASLDVVRPLPVVLGWPDELKKVFQNLLSNALKYNDKASPQIRVFGRTSSDGGRAVIAVQDNGIGIPPRQLTKVFRMFMPLHDKERFPSSYGAGLAIVKKIVGLHRGRIRVHSRVGEGTTFVIRLPTPVGGNGARVSQ